MDGVIYTGYFKEDRYEGVGVLEHAVATTVGTFKDSEESGWCTVRYGNGNYYIGEMNEGKMSGFGLFITDGDI